jgi:ribosomal protein S18 acetylase RimI-like enzyme
MNPVDESVHLMIDAWKTFVGRMPRGRVTQSDGVVTALANVELPFLNMCLHDSAMEDLDDLHRRLDLCVRRAADCPFPWLLAVCEEWAPAGWEAALERHGLAPAMPLVGMAADKLKPPRRPLPELEYRRVDDVDLARNIAELNMHAYGLPLEMADCISNMHLWAEDSHGYVGFVDGRPVTCSASFPVNGTVYIGFVATHPDEHRKGYAEAVMRHSIEKGFEATGFTRTTLHATEAGFPLYEAMGYHSQARFTVISEPHED